MDGVIEIVSLLGNCFSRPCQSLLTVAFTVPFSPFQFLLTALKKRNFLKIIRRAADTPLFKSILFDFSRGKKTFGLGLIVLVKFLTVDRLKGGGRRDKKNRNNSPPKWCLPFNLTLFHSYLLTVFNRKCGFFRFRLLPR